MGHKLALYGTFLAIAPTCALATALNQTAQEPAKATPIPSPSPTPTAPAIQTSTGMPPIAKKDGLRLTCTESIITLAPGIGGTVASVCPIFNATLPLFDKIDQQKVAPRIPYVEDDTRFYVPLLTSAASRKGRPILVTFQGASLSQNDFYTIQASGSKPKLGVALEYIRTHGGRIDVAPTNIGDSKDPHHVSWIAQLIGFIVKAARGNSMKGLKKYDVVFFVAPGADLHATKIDHLCFNPRGVGIKDCLDAAQK